MKPPDNPMSVDNTRLNPMLEEQIRKDQMWGRGIYPHGVVWTVGVLLAEIDALRQEIVCGNPLCTHPRCSRYRPPKEVQKGAKY